MPRRNTDTRAEIRQVALELFATKGFEQTSLREIAERLDITKAALYYHFPSKDELLADVVEPLVADIGAFVDRVTELLPDGERGVLEAYFDLCHRHRLLFQGVLADLTVLARVELLPPILARRAQVDRLLVGRVVVALGGLQDCAVLMTDVAVDAYRTAAVDSALRALLPVS